MTTPAAFKKAMQQLTTTIVHAERAAADGPAIAQLKADVRTQLDALLALHAGLVLDEGARAHQGWFDKTVARARAILGDA